MFELIANANIDSHGFLNPALLFGLVILFGTLASKLCQKCHIPQVVGCIVAGIILGDVLHLIKPPTIESLEPFTMFALGLIGFMIGGELRVDVFKKYGRQFFIILFAQGIGAFVLVVAASVVLMRLLHFPLTTAFAVSLVLGAIASATAPAATVNVLWEYKTRGPLTAAILAIVALDDALALLLYRAAATGAKALVGDVDGSIIMTVLILLGEILGAIVLGFLAGITLYYLLKFVRSDDKILEFAISCLLLVVGLSMIPKIDPILPAMTLGITIANLMPRRSEYTFELVKKFTPPVYVAFFVLAGAHMEFGKLAFWMIAMIAVYTIFRAAGKIAGSWFGAKYSDMPTTVRKYLGICLLPQAGVAIGLAILAGKQFESNPVIAHAIIMVVMTATFLMEIIGPILVKIGVNKAGEVGMNVTEEDLINTYSVNDVMEAKPTTIPQALSLPEILDVFSTSDTTHYPVVDNNSRLTGIITIPNIKDMFANRDVAAWLLACDVAEPVIDKAKPDEPLSEAIERMRKYNLDSLVVVTDEDDERLAGMLDYRKTLRKISAEVLTRRKNVEHMDP